MALADEGEGLQPVEPVHARREMHLVIHGAGERPLDVDVHTAEGVRQGREALEVQHHRVVDVLAQQRLHRPRHQGQAAEFQSGVHFGFSVARDIHPQVAHDRDAVDALPVRRDVDQHQGVPALVGGGAGGGRRPLIHPAVAPDQQDVEGDGGWFRRGRGAGRRCGLAGVAVAAAGAAAGAATPAGPGPPGRGRVRTYAARPRDGEREQNPQKQDDPTAAAARRAEEGRGRRGSRGCWLRSVPHERTLPPLPAAD